MLIPFIYKIAEIFKKSIYFTAELIVGDFGLLCGKLIISLFYQETFMTTFAKMSWKPEKLKKMGLPNCLYPIPSDLLPEVISSGKH